MTPKSEFRGRFVALFAILAISVLSPTITSANDLIFGPVTCQRGTGAPTVFNYSFATPEPSQGFIFKVYNGGLEDTTYEQVSSSTIMLNGIEILGPSNFNQNVTNLEVPVNLHAQNTLSVEVRGKPGGAIIIKVYPFVVINTPFENHIFSTDLVTVSGHLYAATTSVSVNGFPATVGAGTFSVTGIPLTHGSNTLTATAMRADGFAASDSVHVTLDSIAPIVSIEHPQEGLVTNQNVVPLYTATDALDPNPTVSVSPLPPYIDEGAYQMSVVATDWAGNSATATRSFVIDKTAPTITFAFPTNGLLTNQEMVPVYTVMDSLDPHPAVSLLPPPPYLTEGSHQVTLTAMDWAGNQAHSTRSFMIDLTPPVVGGLTPAPKSATADAQAVISASISDALSGIKAASIRLQIDSADVTSMATITELGVSYLHATALADGPHQVALTVWDHAGNEATANWNFAVDTTPPAITILAPAEGATIATATMDLSGSVDDSSATVTVNGVVVSLDGNDFSVAGLALALGPNTIHIEAHDALGNSSSLAHHVTYVPPVPTASLTATPAQIQIGGSALLQWTTSNATSVSITPGIGSVGTSGAATITPSLTTTYTISATGPGGQTVAQAAVIVLEGEGSVQIFLGSSTIHLGESTTLSWAAAGVLNPIINNGIGSVGLVGSQLVAPTSTTEYTLTAAGPHGVERASIMLKVLGDVAPPPSDSFGAQYGSQIPPDATVASYEPVRFSLITGAARNKTGQPLSNVAVTVRMHPEYGTAYTNLDGAFTLPMEGGGYVEVILKKEGYITAHRLTDVKWNDIARVEAVIMQEEDAAVTSITFDGNPTSVVTHRSTSVADESGARACTMVFQGDNRAYAQVDGVEISLGAVNVRATEFEVPKSMPANLPANSGFTYCVNLSVDGAEQVRFEKPVIMYVDNFLGFPVGMPVPVGYYDYQKAVWVPSINGVVVQLLDVDGDGVVDALDATGDGVPDDLDSDGQTIDEVDGIKDSATYLAQNTYWRVQVGHFTPWDCNWPYGPPANARAPSPDGKPVVDQQLSSEKDPSVTCGNSFVEDESRIYHEDIPIPGTELTLHYASNRVKGYKTSIVVPVSGSDVPSSVKQMIARLEVAGIEYEQLLAPAPMQKVSFEWDGRDHLGNVVQDSVVAKISIGYVYDAVYLAPADFKQAFAQTGGDATAIRGRQELVLWQRSEVTLDTRLYVRKQFNGSIADGWTISAQHMIDRNDPSKLYKGDGTISQAYGKVLTTIAGTGTAGYAGDNGPATDAQLYYPGGIAIDNSGNIYIADKINHRIRKVDPSGTISTFAGTGQWGDAGDGGPATLAKIYYPTAVSFDGQGNLYIADSYNCKIRKVDPQGTITTVAGYTAYRGSDLKIKCGYAGDGGPATSAKFNLIQDVAADKDGNVYVADSGNYRVRKISTNGIVSTVAGNGVLSYTVVENVRATETSIPYPDGLDVDSRGNIYIVLHGRIRKVNQEGIIKTVAGNGGIYLSGDGGKAVEAGLGRILDLHVDHSGNLYFANLDYPCCRDAHKVRMVDTNGIITTVAGKAPWGVSADGGLAADSSLYYPGSVAVDGRGTIYFTESTHKIRKIAYPQALGNYVASEDLLVTDQGGEGYVLGRNGLHKSTLDLITGVHMAEFGYTSDGLLTSIQDRFGNFIHILRNDMGVAYSIVSPTGVETALDIDVGNHLRTVTFPDGSHYRFDYSTDGLLTDENDPNSNHFVHVYSSDGRLTDLHGAEGEHDIFVRSVDSSGSTTAVVSNAYGESTRIERIADTSGRGTIHSTSPDGSLSTTTQSADMRTTTIETSCGTKTVEQYDYDKDFQKTYLKSKEITLPSGTKSLIANSFAYEDTDGDKFLDKFLSTTTRNGHTWESVRDTLLNTVTNISPGNRTMTLEYDPLTLLPIQESAPGLLPAVYSYDGNGRISGVSVGSRNMSYAYDANSYLDYVTTSAGTIDYTYDIMGRQRSVVRADGSTIEYRYDGNGNVSVLTNPNEASYEFSYTANNQRRNYAQPLSGAYELVYDFDRRLKSVTAPSGEAIVNTYVDGNLASTATPEGVIAYEYLCGSRLGSAARNGERVYFTHDGPLVKSDTRTGILATSINYTYTNDFVPGALTYAGSTANFGYDTDGLLTSAGGFTISRNALNGLPENLSGQGLAQTRTFNGYGELDGLTSRIGGAQAYAWLVPQRDNAGRVILRSETLDGSTTAWEYSYNAVGRLMEVKKNGVVVESYTYDTNGNRMTGMNTLLGIVLGRSYQYTAEDHVLTAGAESYQFDVDGFLHSKTTADGTSYYQYSSRGELLRMDKPDGTILSYVHDPFGRRIAKKVNGTTVEKYLWANRTMLLAVYDGSDNLLQRYTYADVRDPVSMTAGGATYFLLTDQVGTLRAVADTSGNIVKRIDYDSFGNITNDTNPSFSVPFGFAGGLHDRDTGLVRFGYRDYSPELGRWTAKDPLDFGGGDTNLYGYVTNNPINLVDPIGLEILVCNRKVSGFPFVGNHTYAWDTTTNSAESMRGSSGSREDSKELGPDRGSGRGDQCTEVKDSKGKEAKVMNYLRENENNGLWFPYFNDCHNAVNDAVSYFGLEYPGAPGGRWGEPR